jgi:DNA polymerase iota
MTLYSTNVTPPQDYDCFYAAVFEAKNPSLKALPFAVQQKQIIVTCNYTARSRGLHKLQLIRDARRICPDVIIELGEDISRFRDASKELYKFIEAYTWNGKVERLGFDEVFMDVTDMIEYNMDVLNRNNLRNSFFQTSRDDPTMGFLFDASAVAGHVYPQDYKYSVEETAVDDKTLRLRLGSHLAMYMRHELEQHKGYTATVGIATNKVLAKLVGNLHKPKDQTTLMPRPEGAIDSNAMTFIGDHELGKIPGIGFKLAQKLREFVLNRPADFDHGLVYGGTKEHVTVAVARQHPQVNPDMLEKLLAGPGSQHGIGQKIWCLLHAIDDSEVSQMRTVPRQISIEDSYIRLDTLPEVYRELNTLAKSLLTRMRIDLLGDEGDDEPQTPGDEGEDEAKVVKTEGKKWLAHPKTLRLTTRPRQALLPDGTRPRSFKRISHSAPLPNFVFGLSESIDSLADKLVKESLMAMFRKLHPEKAGWNLSLVNLAVTNMAETAGNSKTANGRDIGNMFKRQEDVLKDFRVLEQDDVAVEGDSWEAGVEDVHQAVGEDEEEEESQDDWDAGDDDDEDGETCGVCGIRLPSFAMVAHRRFHYAD